MIPSVIEPRHIDWPDWETRFTGSGKGRHIPVEQASPTPAPEPYKPVIPAFLPPRQPQKRKHGQFPAECTDPLGHRMVSNGAPWTGKYRMKCSRCGRSRLATDAEAAELVTNGGRKGRRRG